ncbi:hypothetical protein DEO72_LG11g547 [Vigna unguiculata]|uniref:Uncharacterized protein n=1 Tax=Vigna unguiculata TaxID=3917 RepID=A0A4D6NI69_VIGUN|nr:hypothetical protein DEO72_LG11g547 [Vigna unguiculata]
MKAEYSWDEIVVILAGYGGSEVGGLKLLELLCQNGRNCIKIDDRWWLGRLAVAKESRMALRSGMPGGRSVTARRQRYSSGKLEVWLDWFGLEEWKFVQWGVWRITEEWSVDKPARDEVLRWRLATGFNSPGGSSSTVGLNNKRRLAVREVPPGDRERTEAIWVASAWRWERFRQAVVADFVILLEALGAWRHVSPARRSGSWQCLAVRVPRQAIYTAAALSFDYEFVIYSAFNGALKVRLLVFLELWLGTYPLSYGSG